MRQPEQSEQPVVEVPNFVIRGCKPILGEEIYDPENGARFAVWDGEKVQYVSQFQNKNRIYVPRMDDGVPKGIIKLPTCAEEFGSVEELIEEIKQFCRKYLDVRQEFLEVAAWYVLLSWVYDRVSTIAYLRAMGDWGTGKSRFLDVIGGICYRLMNASGATSAAAVSRLIELWGGTLALNEADWEKSDERQDIVRILNEGFEKSRAVIKAHQDKQKELIYYDGFGPKIIATRKPFDDPALESRCLTEVMQETHRDEIPPVLTSTFRKEELRLRNKLLMFRFKHWEKIREATIEEVFPKLIGKLERRLIQATITFSTLFADDEELFNRFVKFLEEYQRDLKEQRAGTYEGLVVNAIYELGIAEHGIIAAGDIAKQIVDDQGWEKPPDARTIGKYLRALGITTRNTKFKDESGKERVVKAIVWEKEQLLRIVYLIKKYVPGEVALEAFVANVAKGIQITNLDTFMEVVKGAIPSTTHATNANTLPNPDATHATHATVSDIQVKLWEAFGVNPFKPSEYARLFKDDELPKVAAVIEEMLKRGDMMVVPYGDEGQMCFQLVRRGG